MGELRDVVSHSAY